MIEDKELAQLFKAESAEHLARLDDGLLRLEKTPADQPLLEEVFRESHSLKGAARMLGLTKIESAAHGLETILNTARKGETPLTPDVIERMTAALGDLRKLVQEALGAPASGSIPPPSPAIGGGSKFTPPPQPSPALRAREGALTPFPSQGEGWDGGKNPGNLTSSTPSLTLPLPGGGDKGLAEEPFRIETVRVETRKLDDLLTLVGELSVIEGRVQHRLSLMDDLLEQWALLERSRKKFQSTLRDLEIEAKTSEALRTENEMLAQFGDLLKKARDAFYEDSARLETTVNTLEERVHAARLLPLSTVFTLFPRMVRDLAKAQDKEVELLIEGGEIGVDKRILEEMKDPLMHMLRNAVDHGIEPAAERARAGKPETGSVKIKASQSADSIVIEVSDDGRGLDQEAIKGAALQRGLTSQDALDAMSPEQIHAFIFAAGISTAGRVTDVSGRGVGMSVVSANVQRLKGAIALASTPGQGTRFTITLPLTISTLHVLLVAVNGHSYGLPLQCVQSLRALTAQDVFTLEGHSAILHQAQPILVAGLADLLELPGAKSAAPSTGVVFSVGADSFGIFVDALLGEQEVMLKPQSALLERVRNVAGATVLGNGEICMVLNEQDLAASIRQGAAAAALATPAPAAAAAAAATPAPKKARSILLAEDSPTMLAQELRILEGAGYEVVSAVDGQQAWSKLSTRAFDAVVTDVLMPKLDGLGLAARIRSDARYAALPIILLTSLSSDEDKRRGLNAGADAYLTKSAFDQQVLLDCLSRLIL